MVSALGGLNSGVSLYQVAVVFQVAPQEVLATHLDLPHSATASGSL